MSKEKTSFSRRRLVRFGLMAGLAVVLPVEALAAHKTSHPSSAAEPYVPHQTGFASATVDPSGLSERGLPNYAARIARLSSRAVRDVFADRLASGQRGAPRVIVRVDTIELGNAESVSTGFFGSGAEDSISGAVLVVDAGGRVLFEKPLWTSVPVQRIPGDIVSAEDFRATNLVATLARWAKQDV